MLIRDRKHFATGAIMAVSFFCLFAVIMSPVFGDGKNGLEYADDIFNRLSKGSADFGPKTAKNVEKFVGKPFSAAIKFANPDNLKRVQAVLISSGAQVEAAGDTLKVEGDLGKFLGGAVKVGDLMYKNDGEQVKAIYGGADPKQVLKDWWTALSRIDKSLQDTKNFEGSRIVSEVYKKVIETSYNYYGIPSQKVTDRIGTMAFLLCFYVIYTLWWGYALYHLFEGMGLTARKAKIKKEI